MKKEVERQGQGCWRVSRGGLQRTERPNHVGELGMKNSIGDVRRHWNQKHKSEGLLRKSAHHLFFIEDQSKEKELKLLM